MRPVSLPRFTITDISVRLVPAYHFQACLPYAGVLTLLLCVLHGNIFVFSMHRVFTQYAGRHNALHKIVQYVIESFAELETCGTPGIDAPKPLIVL